MSKVPIKPLGERIVATREEAAAKTASGLYLPDNAKEKSQIAKVVAVGASVKEVKSSDRIIVREYSTTEVKVDSVEYLIVKEEDVLATIV
ncbi:co-chaperone GroES [Candidatus Saccharibacteria bacterium]|nr:co-chaperone GroES [Candidatus Saccharibacteria bacterium]